MASIFKAVLYLSVLLFRTWETLGRVFGVKLLKEGNSVCRRLCCVYRTTLMRRNSFYMINKGHGRSITTIFPFAYVPLSIFLAEVQINGNLW